MRKNHLKAIVRLLKEAEAKEQIKLPGDSLDAQVDKFLVDFESASAGIKKESYNFRDSTRRLLEAEGDDDASSQTTIDMEEFGSSVARLIFNYDNLLEFRNTLIKRTYNYLLQNSSSAVAKEFLDFMRRNYDIELDKSIYDKEDEIPQPDAVRSGGGGGGT